MVWILRFFNLLPCKIRTFPTVLNNTRFDLFSKFKTLLLSIGLWFGMGFEIYELSPMQNKNTPYCSNEYKVWHLNNQTDYPKQIYCHKPLISVVLLYACIPVSLPYLQIFLETVYWKSLKYCYHTAVNIFKGLKIRPFKEISVSGASKCQMSKCQIRWVWWLFQYWYLSSMMQNLIIQLRFGIFWQNILPQTLQYLKAEC